MLSRRFDLSNAGDAPLTVLLVKPCCAYHLSASAPSGPIAPGATREMTLFFWSRDARGALRLDVDIMTDGPESRLTTLNVRADVAETSSPAPLVLEPDAWDVGVIRPGQEATTKIVLRNSNAGPVLVRYVAPSAGCVVMADTPAELAPGEELVVDVTLIGRGSHGAIDESVAIQTGASAKPVLLRVTGYVSPGQPLPKRGEVNGVSITYGGEPIRVPGLGKALVTELSVLNTTPGAVALAPAPGPTAGAAELVASVQIHTGQTGVARLRLRPQMVQGDDRLLILLSLPVIVQTTTYVY